MRAGESKHPSPILLLDEDEQPRSGILVAERHRVPRRIPLPERDESSRLGRGVARSPDMPDILADLDDPGLVIAVLRLGDHSSGHTHLSRVDRKGFELHTATLAWAAILPTGAGAFSNTSSNAGQDRPPRVMRIAPPASATPTTTETPGVSGDRAPASIQS